MADTLYNGTLIMELMKECTDNGAKVVVFPNFALRDIPVRIFWQDKLIRAAEAELIRIADYSKTLDGIFLWAPI